MHHRSISSADMKMQTRTNWGYSDTRIGGVYAYRDTPGTLRRAAWRSASLYEAQAPPWAALHSPGAPPPARIASAPRRIAALCVQRERERARRASHPYRAHTQEHTHRSTHTGAQTQKHRPAQKHRPGRPTELPRGWAGSRLAARPPAAAPGYLTQYHAWHSADLGRQQCGQRQTAALASSASASDRMPAACISALLGSGGYLGVFLGVFLTNHIVLRAVLGGRFSAVLLNFHHILGLELARRRRAERRRARDRGGGVEEEGLFLEARPAFEAWMRYRALHSQSVGHRVGATCVPRDVERDQILYERRDGRDGGKKERSTREEREGQGVSTRKGEKEGKRGKEEQVGMARYQR
eukprot:2970502-Rhodomonas_salina.1